MSFFKDFKADFTQAMNELMPDGNEMYEDDADVEEAHQKEIPKEEKNKATKKPRRSKDTTPKNADKHPKKKEKSDEDDVDIAPEDMMDQIDDLLNHELYQDDESDAGALLNDDTEVNTMDMSVEELLNQLSEKQDKKSEEKKMVTHTPESKNAKTTDDLSVDDLLTQLENSIPAEKEEEPVSTPHASDPGLEELLNRISAKSVPGEQAVVKPVQTADPKTVLETTDEVTSTAESVMEEDTGKNVGEEEQVVEEIIEEEPIVEEVVAEETVTDETANEEVVTEETVLEQPVIEEAMEEVVEEQVQEMAKEETSTEEPSQEIANKEEFVENKTSSIKTEESVEHITEEPETEAIIQNAVENIVEETDNEVENVIDEELDEESTTEETVTEADVITEPEVDTDQNTEVVSDDVKKVEDANMSEEKDVITMNTAEPVENTKEEKVYNVDEADTETTYITKGTKLTGDLETDGSVDVIGTIEGSVSCKGKVVVGGTVKGDVAAGELYANGARIEGNIKSYGSVKVGVGSMIIGSIEGESAVIAGAVNGDIDVKGPVIVDSTAVIMGNIKSRSVQINNGAVIEGFCSQSYSDIDVKSFFA